MKIKQDVSVKTGRMFSRAGLDTQDWRGCRVTWTIGQPKPRGSWTVRYHGGFKETGGVVSPLGKFQQRDRNTVFKDLQSLNSWQGAGPSTEGAQREGVSSVGRAREGLQRRIEGHWKRETFRRCGRRR